MVLLEARGLVKIFGKLTALNAADLTVAENEFHGLIGPNGSGKSTLMNAWRVRKSHARLGLFCRARHHARHSSGAGAGWHEP